MKRKSTSTLELIELLDRKNDLIKTYLGGMKRRVNIVAVLLHHPQVLFMDESTVKNEYLSKNIYIIISLLILYQA